MNDTIATPDLIDENRDELLARIDAANKIAHATPCDIPDCDRSMHSGDEDPSEWYHRVYYKDVEGLEVEITRHADGRYVGWMAIDFIDDVDSGQLRVIAAECTQYAAELLVAADRVDALNGVVA